MYWGMGCYIPPLCSKSSNDLINRHTNSSLDKSSFLDTPKLFFPVAQLKAKRG